MQFFFSWFASFLNTPLDFKALMLLPFSFFISLPAALVKVSPKGQVHWGWYWQFLHIQWKRSNFILSHCFISSGSKNNQRGQLNCLRPAAYGRARIGLTWLRRSPQLTDEAKSMRDAAQRRQQTPRRSDAEPQAARRSECRWEFAWLRKTARNQISMRGE